jgi:hypothetical protein
MIGRKKIKEFFGNCFVILVVMFFLFYGCGTTSQISEPQTKEEVKIMQVYEKFKKAVTDPNFPAESILADNIIWAYHDVIKGKKDVSEYLNGVAQRITSCEVIIKQINVVGDKSEVKYDTIARNRKGTRYYETNEDKLVKINGDWYIFEHYSKFIKKMR